MNEVNQETVMLHLVCRYIATTTRLATQLRGELGVHDLLGAVNNRVFPRTGHLKDGASYHFHGVGCSVETPTLCVDFDFGPNGRVDGFDAWRLRAFAEQSPDDSQFHDLKVVEAALRDLETRGIVKKLGWAPSPHLYYLSDSVECSQSGQPGFLQQKIS
ncbi:DUF6896 domain-containing protein [Sorangium sp. So ce887]|uniref:DUF6896 domain-containing protein n=1 Tax=Sorangium sp. So ce887 TaxID=3133324 RepID=UPI003F5F5C8A